jgi:hypothetical protein
MDEAKRCPKCGLTNPSTALRCDCGWDFQSRTAARSYLQQGASEVQRRQRAKDQVLLGILLILGGTVATFASFGSSGSGIIFYGVIVVGLIKVFRGLSAG